MREPNFADLQRQRQEGDLGCHSYAQGMYSPLLSKYYWWVFHKDSPCDGWAFLAEPNRLTTAAAVELMERLHQAGEPYWLYNRRVRRWDPPTTPWRHEPGVTYAPAYDQDTDPVHQGHK